MPETTLSNLDKAAALLNRLQPKSLDKVLEMLGPECSSLLRPVLKSISRRSDYGSLSAQVLQEFRELQQDVRASINSSQLLMQQAAGATNPTDPASTPKPEAAPEATAAQPADDAKSPEETAAEDSQPKDAATILAGMSPAVMVAALRTEPARVIAIVIKQVPAELSGKILEGLAPELRQTVFVLLADKTQVNPGVIKSLLEKIVHVCQNMNPAAVEQQDRRLKTLVGILQVVEREERIRLMETLTEHDPELATQIDNSMYDYSDVLRIEDRSVQKLLSQLEQKVVAIALKSSPEDLRQKVLKNLSERVRAALNEEMELLSAIPASKVEIARREIANVIRAQDKEGSLVWVE